MDLMQPGEVIEKGSYKLQMPNLKTPVTPAKNKIPNSAAIPFVDISMAASGSKPSPQLLKAFSKYKYMSFGFISGTKNTDGVKIGK
jgi:hypothetical protein